MRTLVRHSIAVGAGFALAVMGGSAGLAQNANSKAAGQAQSRPTIQMVRTKAQLSTTLDAKKAKQGEKVKAKLLQAVDAPNSQQLPRNTVLEGHVDKVMPSHHKSESVLSVTFDKARLKGGKEIPIKATVLSVSEPALSAMGNQSANMPGGGATEPGTPTAAPGGGNMGGAGRGAMGSSSPAQTAGPQPMGLPEQGSQASEGHRSGVPGVMLTSSIHEKVSATFTSKSRNVKVPNGTDMQMALAVIPNGMHVQ